MSIPATKSLFLHSPEVTSEKTGVSCPGFLFCTEVTGASCKEPVSNKATG
jgi:hypothetical protein